jgi:hypothetical protein
MHSDVAQSHLGDKAVVSSPLSAGSMESELTTSPVSINVKPVSNSGILFFWICFFTPSLSGTLLLSYEKMLRTSLKRIFPIDASLDNFLLYQFTNKVEALLLHSLWIENLVQLLQKRKLVLGIEFLIVPNIKVFFSSYFQLRRLFQKTLV